MNKLLVLAAVAASLMAPEAFAQTRSPGGLSVGVNLNFANASNEFRANNTPFKNGDVSQAANIQAAYGFPVGENFVFGVGVTYGPGEIKTGYANSAGVNYELKVKDIYSLYLEPGFMVGNSSLAYFKVSYQGMKGETKFSSGTTSSDNFEGTGYGAGIRTMLGPNLYLQAEFEQTGFFEKNYMGLTSKPAMTVGTVGLGYRF